MNQEQKHPIAAGLIALVAVAVSIGLILGIVVLVGTRILGIGGDSSNGSSDTGGTLYIPSQSPTPTEAGSSASPSSTAGDDADAGKDESPSKPKKTKKPEQKITLQASAPHVSPMQLFSISGVYQGGEGDLMRLQRLVGGSWQDFGIPDVAVTNGTFSTHVQTGRTGVQKFRVKDVDSKLTSNVVRVTIG